MGLHEAFPTDPHAILDPAVRWFPGDDALREKRMDQLMPPLVAALRVKVKEFRDGGYVGATPTSRSLLNWWFNQPHLIEHADGPSTPFTYFFAQREALETIVYLTDVVGVQDKHDLMRFDSSGLVSSGMFDEDWRRFVVKMATGSGKTKVLSLALVWSFFCKTYEPESTLSRNFLVIAPNIIVLDRIYKDFQGLRIFFQDPAIPDNGFDGRNWREDFQLTLHVQDEVRVTRKTGNIFLTNIHRVYQGNEGIPTPDDDDTMDYFLGKRPTGATTDSKVDLGMIVRDIDELMVLNDEAHHVHDPKMAWFKSIQDIDNKLKQKGDRLSMQIDVTATPKHDNGAIFVQTVADYPLVEAIAQNVVKHPVLPDAPSRAKLHEKTSIKYTEKYGDYIDLGVVEWRKAYAEHQKLGKKAVLFVMTDDTKNCDEVAEYLKKYPDFADSGSVLVIHTKSNGEISEASSGKAKEELEELRKQANSIDDAASPAKVIVSVMMLKEGWDVRNVTTIVGLRAYEAKSNILPEQTLGRGLRKMYLGDTEEYVSVIGTDKFMEFVESIKAEGVTLERKAMGAGTAPAAPLVVEVDSENGDKDLDDLDIALPVLSPRTHREYKNLAQLDVKSLGHKPVEFKQFTEEEQREIVFKDVVNGEITHTTVLDSAGIADYRSVISYFARTLMNEVGLRSSKGGGVGGYDVLYGKVKVFIEDELFDRTVDLEDPNTMRNLSELAAVKTLLDAMKMGVNALTIQPSGNARLVETIKLRNVRPFVAKNQDYVTTKKSVFNRVIGDSPFELEFAAFLEKCADVKSFAKNYLAVNFKLDFVKADGDLSNYYPDFIVKLIDGRIAIVETKGQQDVDVEPKMQRLKQWCQDVTAQAGGASFDFVYVDSESFQKYRPKSMGDVMTSFRQFK
jgi:type III restriction enzyme